MNIKRLFLTIVAIVMAAAGVQAFTGKIEIDGINYDVIDNSVTVIAKDPQYTGDVIIPASIVVEGVECAVTGIWGSAFKGCTGLTSVTIPSSVTTIGDQAFRWCSGLTSVSIPSSVTTIGEAAFWGCTGLTSVTIPSSVTTIGEQAFIYCTGLTSVTIPNSVTSIGRSAFYGCSGLTSVTIPASVTNIGEQAFLGCTGLTSVTIPSSVTTIGKSAFDGCTSLTSVNIPNSVTSIDQWAFWGCTGLTSVNIPNSVTSIGSGAFGDCTGLTSVNIPNSVISIGSNPFSCSSLASIVVESGNTFYDSRDNCNAIIKSSTNELVTGCKKTTIPNSVTSIGDWAFYNCSGLTSVTIPNSVTSIGGGAFCNCSGLTSVTIPESVTSIGAAAFSQCSALTSVTIPNSVTRIDQGAFWVCTGLTSVTIPNSVTSIGESAFGRCSGLNTVTIPNSVTSIDRWAFDGCELESVISLIEEPFAINGKESVANYGEYEGAFDLYTFNNAKLYVPEGTINKYRSTAGWHDFLFIEEGDGTISYILTYVVNGQEYKRISIKCHAAITPEPEPQKEGYTFSGWSEIPETMPDHDVSITGSFIPNKYTITFEINGNVYETRTIDYGTTIIIPELPELTGYTFKWDNVPTTMPAKDITIEGRYIPNTYSVTYWIDDVEYKVVNVQYGTDIIAETNPEKEGYSFSGWSEIPSVMPAHDVTVTGSFTINTYKVIYEVNGDMYMTYEVEYGEEIPVEEALEREGYTFSGWSMIPSTMPAHDVVISASFTKGQYKLIYVIDGEVFKIFSYDFQDMITPEAVPEQEGYTFSGWSEIPETMPAHDVAVTGTFTINQYKLILKVGDNVYETQTLDYGAPITLPEMPELTGYTFAWGEAPETMPAGDVTIVGEYEPNYYNVTYLIDGQFYAIVKVQFGSAITTPDVPEREGSTFTWGDYPTTMPAHDIIIEGTYTDGVNLVQSTQNVEIYSLDGKKMKRMQRGVNIVRRGSKVVKMVR